MDRRATSQEQCPQCGQNTIETRTEHDTFRYGTGDAAVELSVSCSVVETVTPEKLASV